MDNHKQGVNHMEPLARAFSRSVSEHPADGGLFGPQSAVWRVHRDRSFPLAALRSLMVQALHPLAMAGVAEHSNWKEDPFGRLAATSGYILTVTYGDTAAAHKAADRVRAIHSRVNGTDPATILFRAIGPSLAGAGIQNPLADPTIDLFNAQGAKIATDNNWKDSQQGAIQATGLAPSSDLESALLVDLNPGNYTAIVSGVNNATGVGLVEAFNLP